MTKQQAEDELIELLWILNKEIMKMTKEQAKDELIELLWNQMIDLSMMSKIELGDDVIAEIKRLKEIINQNKDE